jgi:hypothetical protein
MTRSASLDPIEARLRAALVDLRPANGAPAALRARVDATPDRIGSRGLAARVRSLAAMPAFVAVVVVAAAIVIAAVSLEHAVAPDNIGGAGSQPVTFDPALEGPGIVHDPIPTLWIVEALVVLLALGLARRWRSRVGFDSGRDMARGLALIVLVAASASIAITTPLKDWGGSIGTALGYGLQVYPPPDTDAPEVYYESAKPGEPMIAFFDVTNTSALPITLEGIVMSDSRSNAGPRWTALALASDPNTFPNPPDKLRVFTPQVIAPNDRITLYLVGKAGPCAFGPGYTVDTVGVTGYASMSRDLQLDYSILGLSATSTFTMPLQLVEPAASRCP